MTDTPEFPPNPAAQQTGEHAAVLIAIALLGYFIFHLTILQAVGGTALFNFGAEAFGYGAGRAYFRAAMRQGDAHAIWSAQQQQAGLEALQEALQGVEGEPEDQRSVRDLSRRDG